MTPFNVSRYVRYQSANVLLASFALTTLFFTSCKPHASENKTDVLKANIDTTVSPAKDFFAFANGLWLKNNPIPAEESRWGIGNLVQEETYTRLKDISEKAAAAKPMQGSAQQKIGDFYFTGMDTLTIEKNGYQPLVPEFNRIQSINDIPSLLNTIALYQTYDVKPLFDFSVSQDLKNSDKMAMYINQGGLGLPNRDYYTNTDQRNVNIRKEYVAYMTRMFTLIGEDAATAAMHSDQVMAIETRLATNSRKLEDLRDPYRNYNKIAVATVAKTYPAFDWTNLLKAMGVTNPDTLIVGQPEFFADANKAITAFPLENWKSYLRMQLLSSFADKLSKPFEQEQFHFRGTVLGGKTKLKVRWKLVLDAEEAAMGDMLGKLYVEKYFSANTRKRYTALVDNIIAAFHDRLDKLDWMSPETKAKAHDKLNKIVKKVGYPDKWKDFSNLTIQRDAYVLNVLRAQQWSYTYQLNKLGKPVDRMEWDMTPQTYNAYYNPSNNEIVLPAAQFIIPGLPDSLADDAVVYAYAGGSTIGHEITHGFDDEGRQFDAQGNLANWWTKEDALQFDARAKVMADQFSGYTVLDSLHVRGAACLGENIADLGGILLGYDAFQKTAQAKEGKKIAGYTPNQRYFLAYALSWLFHQRDQRLAQQIMTDVHAPAHLRVNGPLSDIPEFYNAFDIKPGDPMYRADNLRVKIW